ncbi:MAG: FHA domain-containing protein, partial [Pseudanabaena sp.]
SISCLGELMRETHVSHTLFITDARGSRKLALDGLKYTIGRDVNNNIQLYSRFVSRQHAVLLRVPGEGGKYSFRIIDGDLSGKPSVNGVIINHHLKVVSSYDLRNGDVITLAPNVELTYLGSPN